MWSSQGHITDARARKSAICSSMSGRRDHIGDAGVVAGVVSVVSGVVSVVAGVASVVGVVADVADVDEAPEWH
jgi:hypothetical protein